jgi:hypothetical protein
MSQLTKDWAYIHLQVPVEENYSKHEANVCPAIIPNYTKKCCYSEMD